MSEETYWQQGDQRAYSPLRGRRTADAVVVGGGLTGLTVALWLCRAGLRVVLLEANTLGSGSTACCLGRVSLLSGVSLSRLEKRFGQEWASAYGSFQQNAFHTLQELSREKTVSWDWQTLDDRLLAGEHPCAEKDAFRNRNVLFVSLCGEGMSAASKHGGAASAAVSAFSGPSGRKTRIMHL